MTHWVLDTNVLLDVWVFDDPATAALREALASQTLRWLATPAMRQEWLRVLHYPHLHQRWQSKGLLLSDLMAHFDRYALMQPEEAPRAPWACKDPDDQAFIDLAVAHQAHLLSKDREVLRMKNRLAKAGVQVWARWPNLS